MLNRKMSWASLGVLLWMGCQDPKAVELARAQMCLDQVAQLPDNQAQVQAPRCVAALTSHNSPLAQTLKCSARLIEAGVLVPSRLSQLAQSFSQENPQTLDWLTQFAVTHNVNITEIRNLCDQSLSQTHRWIGNILQVVNATNPQYITSSCSNGIDESCKQAVQGAVCSLNSNDPVVCQSLDTLSQTLCQTYPTLPVCGSNATTQCQDIISQLQNNLTCPQP